MLPTAGVPFLAHLLSRIRAAGIGTWCSAPRTWPRRSQTQFGDGSALGLDLEYVTETEPLGTGGGIRNVLDHLAADDVLIFNGDVLAGTDLGAVVGTHREAEADVTLHLDGCRTRGRTAACPPTRTAGCRRSWRRPRTRRPTRSTPAATCSAAR